MLCRTQITSMGSIYPMMKSVEVIGVAYSRTRKEPARSLDTVSVVNSMTNSWPNTAMPAHRFWIWNTVMPDSRGMLVSTSVITTSMTSGKARQKT